MVKRGIVPQCAVPFRASGRPGSRSDRPGKDRGTRACEAPVPLQAVCRRCREERRITPGSRRGGTGLSFLLRPEVIGSAAHGTGFDAAASDADLMAEFDGSRRSGGRRRVSGRSCRHPGP